MLAISLEHLKKEPTMASLGAIGLTRNPSFFSIQNPKPNSYRFSFAFLNRQNKPVLKRWVSLNRKIKGVEISETTTGSSPGLYSAQNFEPTVKNVDLVLEDVRPYLIDDGGNVDVVSLEDGIISLKLQEYVLKALKEEGIVQPTRIQVQGLLVILSGRDMIGIDVC